MSAGRSAVVLVLSALGSGCTCAAPPSPTLESISPQKVPADTATAVAVRGSGFAPLVQLDVDAPEASSVRGTFALALVRGAERVDLLDVDLVSDRELSATVPALAAAAVWDLELVDPRGRVAVLAAALEVEGAAACGPDGTPCDDGNACTEGDACEGGVCVPGPSASDGTPCDDGNACTQGDACRGGACVSGPTACTNTAPHACLAVTPGVASVGEPFALDPSCSSDAEDAAGALQARIDFDSDGVWDTAFGPIGTPWQHAYPSPGPWTATIEVRDSGGLSDHASRYALVTGPADVVAVTTEADEDDAGATPESSGGTGLSLREAIAYVNRIAAPRTIEVPAGFTIVHRFPLPALSVDGAAVAGAGATLDFPRINQACVTLDGRGQLLLGVKITSCTFIAVMMTGRSAGSRVAECTIGPAATATGIQAQAADVIGPRNVIAGVGAAVRLTADGSVVEENRIGPNDVGVAVSSATATVRRNQIFSNGSYGLQATPSFGSCTVLHNVFDANGSDGIITANFAGGIVARNNLFTNNGGWGIRNGSSSATLDHNGYFGNASGPISSGSPDPTDVVADPRYESDFRLAPGSPAIDRGLDTGLDVNGPADGLFSGAAPDLGAWEAPYPVP